MNDEIRDPDAELRRLLDHILQNDLFDDVVGLEHAVRAEAARVGLDLTPVPAEPVRDDGSGTVGLMRFLISARENEFCGDAIRDDVFEEMLRLDIGETLLRAPDDAILHIPVEKLRWSSGMWVASKDDLMTYLPPDATAQCRVASGWTRESPAAMAASLRVGGLGRAEADEMAARYREHMWVRWGLVWRD